VLGSPIGSLNEESLLLNKSLHREHDPGYASTFHPMQGMATGTNWLPALPFIGPKDLQLSGEKGLKNR